MVVRHEVADDGCGGHRTTATSELFMAGGVERILFVGASTVVGGSEGMGGETVELLLYFKINTNYKTK